MFIAAGISSLSNQHELKNKNLSNINFSYMNINSIRNKFENLREIIDRNFDRLYVAET